MAQVPTPDDRDRIADARDATADRREREADAREQRLDQAQDQLDDRELRVLHRSGDSAVGAAEVTLARARRALRAATGTLSRARSAGHRDDARDAREQADVDRETDPDQP